MADSAAAPTARWFVSRPEIAEVLGVGNAYVSKLVTRGMPRAAHGKYHLPTCVQWALEQLRRANAPVDVDEIPDIVEARRLLYQAQTRRTDLEAAKLSRVVIPADEVREEFGALAAALVAELEALPARLAPELAHAGGIDEPIVQRQVEDACRAARARLERVARERGDSLGSGGGDPAPVAKANGSAVGGSLEDPATGDGGAGPLPPGEDPVGGRDHRRRGRPRRARAHRGDGGADGED